MNTPITLERGKALFLVGPQGGGKTTLARKLAADHGKCLEIDVPDAYAIRSVICCGEEIGTLIINGEPQSNEARALVKTLITNEFSNVRGVYEKEFRNVRNPHIIICSTEFPTELTRRYNVVAVTSAGEAAAATAT